MVPPRSVACEAFCDAELPRVAASGSSLAPRCARCVSLPVGDDAGVVALRQGRIVAIVTFAVRASRATAAVPGASIGYGWAQPQAGGRYRLTGDQDQVVSEPG